MSFRGMPQTLEEKINWLAEQLRNAQRGIGALPVPVASDGQTSQKGDLQVGSATGTLDLLAVGNPGQVLTADPAAPDGVAWEDPPAPVRPSMSGWPWTGIGI